VRRDVETFVPQAKPAPVATPEATPPAAKPAEKAAPAPVVLPTVVGEERYEEVPVSQMRKVIARRLGESMFSAPHFYLTMEINMDKAVAAREGMNEFSPGNLLNYIEITRYVPCPISSAKYKRY
jgi:pyruvate dehydrogenase E2 component (dihydrolipoamide acetyltransferase)